MHFENVFKCARRAGYYSADKTRVDHVAFGVVLGEDSKVDKQREVKRDHLNYLYRNSKRARATPCVWWICWTRR